jgi:hypothetical protein
LVDAPSRLGIIARIKNEVARVKKLAPVVLMCCFVASLVMAQDAVPSEILGRTLFIKVGDVYGTAFTVDYEGKVYLVTAKHVVAGLPDKGATIQVFSHDVWHDYHTVRTIFPKSNDVDIAVFATGETIARPYGIGASGDVTWGQNVWFLGYPWGLHTTVPGFSAPFIKRCTMSAMDALDKDAIVFYIDGWNNPGFSGGPILCWSFTNHVYQVIGVVQGFRDDNATVLVHGEHVKTQFLVNSGILIGYSIDHAMTAIKDSLKP